MKYNTLRQRMILKEYGRHVKQLVENCMAMKDDAKKNQMALEIIELMGQLNPHLRNVEDYRHKLWDHLFMISEFKLEVDSPYPKTTKTQIIEKPEPLKYPQKYIKFRHYGRNVEALVVKARQEENPEKKALFAQCIGNYMKLTYQNWNKENTNDEIIKNDLRLISKGELVLSVEDNISELSRSNKARPLQNNNNFKGNGKNKHKPFNKNKHKPFNKNRVQ